MVKALVTAGGIGSRINSDKPKQFLNFRGKPIAIYTLELLEQNPSIDEINISCLKGWEKELISICKKYNINKLNHVFTSVDSQVFSIEDALKRMHDELKKDDIIFIHVANRPMVSQKIINNSIKTCLETGSAVAFIPSPEVLVDVKTKEILPRENIYKLQTPQVFTYEKIKKSFEESSYEIKKSSSTVCDMMLKIGYDISFIDGTHLNLKITYPEDLLLFEGLYDIFNKEIDDKNE